LADAELGCSLRRPKKFGQIERDSPRVVVPWASRCTGSGISAESVVDAVPGCDQPRRMADIRSAKDGCRVVDWLQAMGVNAVLAKMPIVNANQRRDMTRVLAIGGMNRGCCIGV
jgi:hypothetical protein